MIYVWAAVAVVGLLLAFLAIKRFGIVQSGSSGYSAHADNAHMNMREHYHPQRRDTVTLIL
jgi:hypothetical protein